MTTQAHDQPLGPSPGHASTLGEALEKLFLDNADRGANAANDELVTALRQQARAIQGTREHDTPHLPRPETTAQD
jgi:hypothetical protein